MTEREAIRLIQNRVEKMANDPNVIAVVEKNSC
jgi:hypothetical protein